MTARFLTSFIKWWSRLNMIEDDVGVLGMQEVQRLLSSFVLAKQLGSVESASPPIIPQQGQSSTARTPLSFRSRLRHVVISKRHWPSILEAQKTQPSSKTSDTQSIQDNLMSLFKLAQSEGPSADFQSPGSPVALNQPRDAISNRYSPGSDTSAHDGPRLHFSKSDHANNPFLLQQHQLSLEQPFTHSPFQSPPADPQQTSMYQQLWVQQPQLNAVHQKQNVQCLWQIRVQKPQFHAPYQQQQQMQHVYQRVFPQASTHLQLPLSQLDPVHYLPLGSTQPWMTEFSQPVEGPVQWNQSAHQVNLNRNANTRWTSEPSPSPLYGIGHNPVRGCSPTFPASAPTTIDHIKRNVERQYRVETKGKVKVKKSLRRYTRDEKARIVEYHKNHPNMSYGKIANKLGCSKTSVHRIIKGDDT
ncbi:MAG: hypothetical protein J3Q66DRAFT_405307 [Benniella sp.]|nr:MAG: hypothetical protein J3Q66DRAFT_405307 [Benniella sp.]